MDTSAAADILDFQIGDMPDFCFDPPALDTSNQRLPAPRSKIGQQPAATNAWDPRLILDLALRVDSLDDILARYSLTRQEYDKLSDVPAFRRDLAVTIRDVRENGATFRQKAKIQAESYLDVLDELVYADDTSANVRLDAIKFAVRCADLEPKETKAEAQNATQVNVNINLG
jgi:hypothetical protein